MYKEKVSKYEQIIIQVSAFQGQLTELRQQLVKGFISREDWEAQREPVLTEWRILVNKLQPRKRRYWGFPERRK